MRTAAVCSVVASLVLFASAEARADYSEAVNGSFSSVNTAPTNVPVTSGSNKITGNTGQDSASTNIDDYFMITVPAGQKLTSITLTSASSSLGSSDLAFFGVASGTSISSSDDTAAGMLGWVHFGASLVGTNLLPSMATSGFGATDFTPPLPAGTYSFRVQDNDTNADMSYQFNLVLTPATNAAPAFGGWPLGGLLACALAMVGALASRRRHPAI